MKRGGLRRSAGANPLLALYCACWLGGILLSVTAGAAQPPPALGKATPVASTGSTPIAGAMPSAGSTPIAGAIPSGFTPPAASGSSPGSSLTCTERIPEGKAPPKMTETFPAEGKSGHQAVLVVDVEHGPGERVLPAALDVDVDNPTVQALRAIGFRLPRASGPSKPRVERVEEGGKTRTRFELPLLLLPSEPGQTELELPPLPIAVSRASGDIITLCTGPHRITVSDPIANEPNAMPKANPAPQRQPELWHTLRTVAYGLGIGALAATLIGLLLRSWMRRPKPVAPPPPPRPPWEVALEALFDIQQSRLIEAGRLGEHFDRVSHVLRRYLGDRYGFDGLESTTREILAALTQRQVHTEQYDSVRRFLEESDLVKFANMTPTEAQCHWLWDSAESIVKESRATAEVHSALLEPAPMEAVKHA